MKSPICIQFIRTAYGHWGGQSGFHQFVKHLNQEHFVSRLHASSDSDDDFPLIHPGLRKVLKARVRRTGMNWYKLSDLWAELTVLPNCLLKHTRIVHFLDGEHGVQFLPSWLKRIHRGRTKVVASYHQPVDILETLINPETVVELDHVNLVSHTQTSYFSRFLPPERISVILHGIDTRFFKPEVQLRDERAFRCITVGHHLRDWKAIAAVAQRLRGQKDVEFHVVTSHPTGLESFENVLIHRNVSDESLLALYQQSDMLFLPLTDSTANNTILEGIACGLPVVSTKLDSVMRYLPGAQALLMDNNHPELLADAVLELRENSDKRLKMGKAARQRAEELSWPNRAREYEKIYFDIVFQ